MADATGVQTHAEYLLDHGGPRPHADPLPTKRARWLRVAQAVLYDFKPPRHALLPTLLWRWLAMRLSGRPADQLPRSAPVGPQGFVGFSRTLSLPSMKEAYRRGLTCTTHYGDKRWYLPPTRAVLDIEKLHLRKELKRKLRQKRFTVTFDRAPEAVVRACAEPRPGRRPITWLTPDMIEMVLTLQRSGTTHTVEVWNADGRLCGGLFGAAIGGVFVVESLFHREKDASKYGFAVLIAHLQAWGFRHVDFQFQTSLTEHLGFEVITCEAYLSRLDGAQTVMAASDAWQVDEKMDFGRWVPSEGPPPTVSR